MTIHAFHRYTNSLFCSGSSLLLLLLLMLLLMLMMMMMTKPCVVTLLHTGTFQPTQQSSRCLK